MSSLARAAAVAVAVAVAVAAGKAPRNDRARRSVSALVKWSYFFYKFRRPCRRVPAAPSYR